MKYIKAQPHGQEYSWHKYWSRKPANVIASYLADLVPKGGFVVDPFSGSGVVLREAVKLGFCAQAFDVNPVAVAISSVMVSGPDPEKFLNASNYLLDRIESELGDTYSHAGKRIRFAVHRVVTKCPDCGLENLYSKEIHGSNGKKCSECRTKLSFGLSQLHRTALDEIVFVDGSSSSHEEDLKVQYSASEHSGFAKYHFSMSLVDNRRTLTSSEITTKDFFTPRNFGILSRAAEMAHQETDSSLRNALLLLVTGSSAQASRLIASRGRLSGGGQAWTIPGFWVPPIHLESNPFVHLRARAKKIHSALVAMNSRSADLGEGFVSQVTASSGLRKLASQGRKADLIFLDPPYGDSVAFMEFSAIWNGFLQKKFEYSDDISVSNRVQTPMTHETYERMLAEIVQQASQVLSDDGKVLLTFNNHDLRAWRGIIQALYLSGLFPISVNYQDPAVVSSKSQKSVAGSYVGDFYVVFSSQRRVITSLASVSLEIEKVMAKSAAVRGGVLTKSFAFRFLIHECLLKTVEPEDFSDAEKLLERIFDYVDGKYILKHADDGAESITAKIAKISAGLDLTIEAGWRELSQLAEVEFRDCGTPSMVELLSYTSEQKHLDHLW